MPLSLGDVDLGTATGRMVARILGAAARQESEHKVERQRRERRQAAEAGRVNGGGMRPFGYERDGVAVNEEEAEMIRECARRVLGGETLSSLARDLRRRDVRTSTGGHFQPRTLRQLLGSARVSGRREHRPGGGYRLVGEIVGTAVWPAIITTDDSDEIRKLLSQESRRTVKPGEARTYLLSGILRCSRCGFPLVGGRRAGVPRYACNGIAGTGACGGIATQAERTDAYARDLVLVALAGSDLRSRLEAQRAVDPALKEAVARDERKLVELAEAWGQRHDDDGRLETRAGRRGGAAAGQPGTAVTGGRPEPTCGLHRS